MNRDYCKLYTVMVADLFHHGHVEFLRAAKSKGDYLVVGVAPDEGAAGYKRIPVMNLEERMKMVAACRYVDEVQVKDQMLDDAFMQAQGFAKYVYAARTEAEHRRFLDAHEAILSPHYLCRLPYTEGISTSDIIQRIIDRQGSL